MNDPDLGMLMCNEEFEGWEGSIRLSSEATPERTITSHSRRAIDRLRQHEPACRQYAADELGRITHENGPPQQATGTQWTRGFRLPQDQAHESTSSAPPPPAGLIAATVP